LATGSELTLLSPPQPLLGAAESKGLLAYAREDRGIYGVRRGSRHARRLTRDAGTIHGLNSRWLLYEEVQPTFSDRPHEIKVLDLRTRRTRVLATDDRFDSDCRCVNRVTEIAGAALDGNFA